MCVLCYVDAQECTHSTLFFVCELQRQFTIDQHQMMKTYSVLPRRCPERVGIMAVSFPTTKGIKKYYVFGLCA